MKYATTLCAIAVLLIGCTSTTPTPTATPEPTQIPAQILFDDFSYSNTDEMTANGWFVRDGGGLPGVTGATFSKDNVTFMDYPNQTGNRFLRMTSSTDGTGTNTSQAQICHSRKYLEGTYAARVRFNDEPVSGTDGDQIVETFYMITPYDRPYNPDYSELDFEYLANGGWGGAPTTMHVTTWETVQIEPWDADNASNATTESLSGWHTLVVQVTDGTVRYFVDEQLVGQHGGEYYPEALMSINFNLWFIEGGLQSDDTFREYEEDIDWVFHEAGTSLMPDEVTAKVSELRNASVKFQDTVMTGIYVSPCDL
ncbi:MAG: glycoside hydrolase family 16 protein [Anaerolineales bacterium]|nr:glycoside hydrolase family 16 protein [Anaerolineales bacterium]